MKPIQKIINYCFLPVFLLLMFSSAFSQKLSDFKIPVTENIQKPAIENKIRFNGYTNHWQNYYTEWFRYGNLFKMAAPDVQPTILQSKIDVAEDLGYPGLLLQEGFITQLFSENYKTLNNPAPEELEKTLASGNVLVVTSPLTELGSSLEQKADFIFDWTENLLSYQFGAVDFEKIKAFYLVNGNQKLFVVSSPSTKQINSLLEKIEDTKNIMAEYNLHKGWFGAATLLKSVTCAPGYPLELIGKGMNEGNSWFIFDGYMDFMAKNEIENWVKEVNLPVVANVGFSPIYGCTDYEGLQVQDMATSQAWIDYAHKKGGYAFRPVYDPVSDAFEFDGYIATEGNKEQIDNENVPFINKTGMLSENMLASTVLFIEKNKPLSNESIWDAIMNRKEVAILDQAKMMGPAKFRNALELLYLDKEFLMNYFGDYLDIQTKIDRYNLIVTLKNFSGTNISGNLYIEASSVLSFDKNFPENVSLAAGETKEISILLNPSKDAMGKTNPVAVHFKYGNQTKSTVASFELPPAISVHQLLFGNEPKVSYPVSVHNFTKQTSFPVEIKVFQKNNLKKPVFQQTKTCETPTASHKDLLFDLELKQGEYTVEVSTLGAVYHSQLGVGNSKGASYLYEVDLNSDGINEYRMENDSVQVTLLRTGARVIEYIVKSKNDNVLFKIWPEKTYNDKRPFRKRGYYPYGGFEDFLGQASMETHKIYDAKIIRKEGDFVRVEMNADYFGNQIKKTFTLYGNSPLLEVRFELRFKNPEANVLGPQPILELGKTHGTEDLFTVPTMDGLKEYRMRPEEYYGQAIAVKEGWNAGYDTKEHISFVGAFPVSQPLFLHMWMNHPDNAEAPHYYVEFQPWTPIIQKTTMYFSYYIWGSGADWQNGVSELRKRNLISTR